MLEINQKSLTVPLIQGGMGVGVSLGSLAGHVAKCGAMGVISTAHPGYKEDDFECFDVFDLLGNNVIEFIFPCNI